MGSGVSKQKSHIARVNGEKAIEDKLRQQEKLERLENICTSKLKSIKVKSLQEQAACLEEVGDLYLDYSQSTHSGREYTKAAALYNAALARYKEEGHQNVVQKKLKNLEKSYVQSELNPFTKHYDKNPRNKQILRHLRVYCKRKLNIIDRKYPAYEPGETVNSLTEKSHEEKRELEKSRAEAVESLFLSISQRLKFFISILLKQCIRFVGPPPCQYVLIGLGSLARDMATPFSNFESAILIEEGKDSEENKQYFRLLVYYLHIKVINLGETIDPAKAIKSFTDFLGNQDWFSDEIFPRGFAYGSMPWASRMPLGEKPTSNKSVELIRTPSQMARLLEEATGDKGAFYLAEILSEATFIEGDYKLLKLYKSECEEIMSKPRVTGKGTKDCKTIRQDRNNSALLADMNTCDVSANLVEKQWRVHSVKREVFKFPKMVMNCLSWFFNIEEPNPWNGIRELFEKEALNREGLHNLLVAASLSAEIRLSSYSKRGKQVEEFVASKAPSLQKNQFSANQLKLFRFYYTMLPFKECMTSQLGRNKNSGFIAALKNNHLFQVGHWYNGKIYERLGMYSEAEKSYKKAIKCGDEKPDVCLDLAWLETKLGKLKESKKYLQLYEKENPKESWEEVLNIKGSISFKERAFDDTIQHCQNLLDMKKKLHGEDAINPEIATLLNNLGLAWSAKGYYDKALEFYQGSLAMRKTLFKMDAKNQDIASSLNNIGLVHESKGSYDEAIKNHQDSLTIKQRIYGEDAAHPDLALSLNNLGSAWKKKGEYKKSIIYYQNSLAMMKKIYGDDAIHPDVAALLGNLGSVLRDKSDYGASLKYHQESFAMKKKIYGKETVHLDIAASLGNLGMVSNDEGNYGKAIEYHQESLEMRKQIYGRDSVRLEIAESLDNLGLAWKNQGDYDRAIEYFQKSIAIREQIHGENAAHPDIAASLNNLGNAWNDKGEPDKAVECHQESLRIGKKIYGERAEHPYIAASLNNLGNDWKNKGDIDRAIEFHQASLSMKRQIYGENAMHTGIARSLNNLGLLWDHKGDAVKATRYYSSASAIYKSVFGDEFTHPDQLSIEVNLEKLKKNSGD